MGRFMPALYLPCGDFEVGPDREADSDPGGDCRGVISRST